MATAAKATMIQSSRLVVFAADDDGDGGGDVDDIINIIYLWTEKMLG